MSDPTADPALGLQAAIVALLKGDAGVTALIGTRVYDHVPSESTFPYVSLGPMQVLGDDIEDCGDGSDVTVQIDAWSITVGYQEVKRIEAAVRNALRTYPTVTNFQVSVVRFDQAQFLRDPDGQTRHAAIQLRYLIRHTA